MGVYVQPVKTEYVSLLWEVLKKILDHNETLVIWKPHIYKEYYIYNWGKASNQNKNWVY